MKRFLLLFALALPSFAQAIHVDVPLKAFHTNPVKTWKSTSKAQRFMAITNIAVHALNVADAYTTYRGVVASSIGCEENPLLRTAPCPQTHNLSAWRFGFAKGLIAGAAIMEYAPTWTAKRPDSYYLFFGIINIGASIPLALADAGNVKVLSQN